MVALAEAATGAVRLGSPVEGLVHRRQDSELPVTRKRIEVNVEATPLGMGESNTDLGPVAHSFAGSGLELLTLPGQLYPEKR